MQKALYERLSASPGGLSVPVYDFVPDGTPLPYVTLGTAVETRFDVHNRGGRELLLVLDVWSRESGFKEAQAIAVELDELLDRQQYALSVPGWSVVLVQNQSTTPAVVGGGATTGTGFPTRHVAVQYRVLVQEAVA